VASDPVRVENIGDSAGTGERAAAAVSLAAERRVVMVRLEGDERGLFCAEPPPDVAKEVTAELIASLSKKDVKGELRDSYLENVVNLARRSETVEVYRAGTYALCQYHLNGAIKDADVPNLFATLTHQALSTLEAIGAAPAEGGRREIRGMPAFDVKLFSRFIRASEDGEGTLNVGFELGIGEGRAHRLLVEIQGADLKSWKPLTTPSVVSADQGIVAVGDGIVTLELRNLARNSEIAVRAYADRTKRETEFVERRVWVLGADVERAETGLPSRGD
jgi:hypothetical protein